MTCCINMVVLTLVTTFKKVFYSVLYNILSECERPIFKLSDWPIAGTVLFCSEPRTYKVNLKIVKWSMKVVLIRVPLTLGSLKTSKLLYVSVAVWGNDEFRSAKL